MWIALYYSIKQTILETKIRERSEWIWSFNIVWTVIGYSPNVRYTQFSNNIDAIDKQRRRKSNSCAFLYYFISCSKLSKYSVSKNSESVISRPSHIFFIVETVGFVLLREMILLSVDCVMPHIVDNLLSVMFLSSHSSRIRLWIACVSIFSTPFYFKYFFKYLPV